MQWDGWAQANASKQSPAPCLRFPGQDLPSSSGSGAGNVPGPAGGFDLGSRSGVCPGGCSGVSSPWITRAEEEAKFRARCEGPVGPSLRRANSAPQCRAEAVYTLAHKGPARHRAFSFSRRVYPPERNRNPRPGPQPVCQFARLPVCKDPRHWQTRRDWLASLGRRLLFCALTCTERGVDQGRSRLLRQSGANGGRRRRSAPSFRIRLSETFGYFRQSTRSFTQRHRA